MQFVVSQGEGTVPASKRKRTKHKREKTKQKRKKTKQKRKNLPEQKEEDKHNEATARKPDDKTNENRKQDDATVNYSATETEDGQDEESTRFLYIYEPCTNAFFFTVMVSILQVFFVWGLMVFNGLENDADAGMTAFGKQILAQSEGMDTLLGSLNSKFSVDKLYPIARVFGAWIFAVYQSSNLFICFKYLCSNAKQRTTKFKFEGNIGNSWAVTFSIALRCVVEFFMVVGKCLAFVLSPSAKSMMLDVNLSWALVAIDNNIFWLVEKFSDQMPGMRSLKQTITHKRSNEPEKLRGILNCFIVVFVMSIVAVFKYYFKPAIDDAADAAP